MIQVPGIKYGVKNVVALATLVGAIEEVLPVLEKLGLTDINSQTDFLAELLTSWLEASGRREDISPSNARSVNPQNVVYQGRVLVSVLALVPAVLIQLRQRNVPFVSQRAEEALRRWFRELIVRAGFMERDQFIGRDEFKRLGFLGSGGIAKFRDRLWAATLNGTVKRRPEEEIRAKAELARTNAARSLGLTEVGR